MGGINGMDQATLCQCADGAGLEGIPSEMDADSGHLGGTAGNRCLARLGRLDYRSVSGSD